VSQGDDIIYGVSVIVNDTDTGELDVYAYKNGVRYTETIPQTSSDDEVQAAMRRVANTVLVAPARTSFDRVKDALNKIYGYVDDAAVHAVIAAYVG